MKNGYTEAITVSAISYLLPFRFLGNFEWKIILDTRIDVKLFNRKVKFKFYKYLTDAARVLKWSVICFRSIDSYLKPFPFFFFYFILCGWQFRNLSKHILPTFAQDHIVLRVQPSRVSRTRPWCDASWIFRYAYNFQRTLKQR